MATKTSDLRAQLLRHELSHIVAKLAAESPSTYAYALNEQLEAVDEVVANVKLGVPLDGALFYSFSGQMLDIMLGHCNAVQRAVDKAMEGV